MARSLHILSWFEEHSRTWKREWKDPSSARPARAILLIILLSPLLWLLKHYIWSLRETREFILTSGAHGGQYFKLGTELELVLNDQLHRAVHVKNVESKGSPENLDRLNSGHSHIGFSQDGLKARPHVRALARLYNSPLHLVIRRQVIRSLTLESALHRKGTRFFIGQQGSGTRLIMEFLLKQYGYRDSDVLIVGDKWTFEHASQALRRGECDVGCFLVGYSADALIELASDGHFTLLDVDRISGLQAADPTLEKAEIPPGTYPGQRLFPDHVVKTIATRELLLCRDSLPDRDAYRILEALYNSSTKVVQSFPLLTQLSRIDPEKNFFYPLHPGALSFYRRDTVPPIITPQVMFAAIGYLITLSTALYLYVRRWRVRSILVALERIEERCLGDVVDRDNSALLASLIEIRQQSDRAIDLLRAFKIRDEEYKCVKEYAATLTASITIVLAKSNENREANQRSPVCALFGLVHD